MKIDKKLLDKICPKLPLVRNLFIIATILLMVTCASSCRSKKKMVQKEAITLERTQAVMVDETVLFDITKDSIANTATETITTNKDETIDVETADTEKEVTITKEEKDGKVIWTGTNVKKLSLSKNDNTTKEKDTTNVKLSEIDKSKVNKKETTNTEVTIDFSKDSKNLNIKSTNAWVSIAIGISIVLAVMLIIYLLYRKYRDKLPL